MGSVYLVRDRQTDAQVGLKILNEAAGIDLYRFKREFRALADFRHPNLVTLHELISEGERWFFTMEYVAGVPFDRFLDAASSPPSDPRLLRRTTLQLCEGVQAMHEAGAIHRDLKPTNVLVTAAGRVVILDFGLAKQTTSNSLSGDGIVGTPTHMAPEQVLEQRCTEAADWYAVGSMLYETLAGQPPFQGSLYAILLKKQSEDPTDPRTIHPYADAEMSELCMQLMHRDPGQRPRGPEILARLGGALDKSALRQTNRHPAVRTSAQGICGRTGELDALAQAYLKAMKGDLVVTLVQGTSGIGKTSLVEAFLRSLAAPSPTSTPLILRGRCHERETLPFKAFDSVVDDLSHHLDKISGHDPPFDFPAGISQLAEIFPVLRRIEAIDRECYPRAAAPDASESRNQAFTAFRELLARLARPSPLVIFIDDLQWADRDSFALLRAIMQQPGAPTLHLVLACRSSSGRRSGNPLSPLQDDVETARVETLEVGPLTDADIRTLANQTIEATRRTPALKREIVDSVAAEASGNPFFAVELVQHFLDRMDPEGESSMSVDDSGHRLDGMILKRFGGLPVEAQRMLEIVAVARDPLAQRTLASAVDVTFGGDRWECGISALVDGRWLSRRGRQGEDTVVVYHDRIAEAVLRHLDEATLRRLNQQLALAVEQWDRERKDKLARYWLSAADHARAKRYAIAAAQEAHSKLAFDRAAELYETAIRLESDAHQKVELLRALGDCRAGDGHAIAAAEAYQRAAAGSDATQSLRLHHLAAEQLLRGGHIAQGLDILEGVLKQAGLRMAVGPRRALLSVLWRLLRLHVRGTDFVERPASSIPKQKRRLLDVLWSANIGLGMVDILRADDFLLRFLFLALEVGDLRRVAQGLAVLGGQLASLGSSHMPFARKLIARAEVLAKRSGDPAVIGLCRMTKGVVSYFAGEWESTLAELTAAEEHFLGHCHGVSWELATTRTFICFTLRALGGLRELCQRFDRYTADADRTGDRYLATNLRTYLSMVWLIRDDIARARKDLEGLLDLWPGDKYQVQHFFHLYARCEHALYEDRPEVAVQAMAVEEARLRASAMLKIRGLRADHTWLTGRLALAMAERTAPAGRPPLLRKARRCARYLLKFDQQTAVAMGAMLAAGARWLSPGADREAIATALAQAVESLEATGARSLAESGRYWLGGIVGGARGGDLRARAERWLVEQGVQDPARMAYSILPGFRASPGLAWAGAERGLLRAGLSERP
jgi:serine/threonine protein kinase